jgi:hypothetical protein
MVTAVWDGSKSLPPVQAAREKRIRIARHLRLGLEGIKPILTDFASFS